MIGVRPPATQDDSLQWQVVDDDICPSSETSLGGIISFDQQLRDNNVPMMPSAFVTLSFRKSVQGSTAQS